MVMEPMYLVVFTTDRGILIRIHVASPPEPKPLNLKKLLSALDEGLTEKALVSLAKEFPRDSKVLRVLQKIISLGVIRRESISGIHWGSDGGHSIHVTINTP